VTVSKINGWRAPYRSSTFQEIADAQVGLSGLLSVDGLISQAGPTITVPAFRFIQTGLIVSKTTVTTLSAPSLDAPFYLVVTSPTGVQVDDLIFSFAKTPLDISINEVLLGSYDGVDWRLPPFLSISGIFDYIDKLNIDTGRIGPFSGLRTSLNGPNYDNSPGTLVDKNGQSQSFASIASFPVVAADPDWARVDRILYRRPRDSENRIGIREFALGGTYDVTPATLYDTQLITAGVPHQTQRVLIASDNTAHIFSATGYGTIFSITYSKLSSDRQTVLIAPATIVASMSEKSFGAAIDGSDNLYLTYTRSGNIFFRKFTSAGVPVFAEAVVDTQSGACGSPKISIDPSDTKVFIVYQALLGPSNNQIFFTTRALGGALITAPLNVTNNAQNTITADIFVSEDLFVYITWANQTTGAVLYRVFDDIGVAFAASATTISTNVEQIGVGLLTGSASAPRVLVAGNRELIIAFLQDKGGSVFGISVHAHGASFMQELTGPAENFLGFDLQTDPVFNSLMLVAHQAASVDFIKLYDREVSFVLNLSGTGSLGVALARDKLGSLLHIYSNPAPGTFTSYDAVTSLVGFGAVSAVGGFATINVGANQLLVTASTLSQAPDIGDRVVVSGSGVGGNNGTKPIIAVELRSLNALDDVYLVTISTNFAGPEHPSTANGNFQAPDGNAVRFVKSVSEHAMQVFSYFSLDSDILLARIVPPGTTILNWVPPVGPGSLSDFVLAHGNFTYDWELTAAGEFTFSSGFTLTDLFTSTAYVLTPGSYPMLEGEAIYVILDNSDLTPTPLVTNISTLPWNLPINILGVIRENRFIPSTPNLQVLESTEEISYDENLSTALKARLGITSDVAFQAYTSTVNILSGDNYPAAISKLDAEMEANQNRSNQDRQIGAIGGGRWAWNFATSTLSWSSAAYIQVPGTADTRNTLVAASIVLADGEVAYVSVNRTAGVAANLTVSKALISALSTTNDNLVIFARRNGQVCSVIGSRGELRLVPGDVASLVRESAIVVATVIEKTLSALPSGVSSIIDGRTLVDGDRVLFTHASLDGVYYLSGVGVALVWTKLDTFAGDTSPDNGSMVYVQLGDQNANSILLRDAFGWREANASDENSEPTGFTDRTQSTIAFVDGTRTFSITPVGAYFDYYTAGTRHRKTVAQTLVIPDVEGFYFIYFNGETLEYATSFTSDILTRFGYAATVYWDATNNVSVAFGDERHGMVMDHATHKYLHLTVGTALQSGGSLASFTTTGTGALAADAQIGLTDIVLFDEDIQFNISDAAVPANPFEQILDPAAQLPIIYRNGAAGDWRIQAATAFPVLQGTARIQWNNPAGPWTQVDAQQGYFVPMWIFATNDPRHPVVAMLGQAEYSILNDALEQANYDEILFGLLPSQEMKVLYRLIFETSTTYVNTPHARLVDARDLRFVQDNSVTAVAAGAHNNLVGRDAVDTHPATAISVETTNFVRALDAAAINAQLALEGIDDQIDKFFGQLRLYPHPTDPERLILTGADVTMLDSAVRVQTLGGLLMNFTGAEIVIEGVDEGTIFASDGFTPIGAFVVATPSAGLYRWYAVAMNRLAVGADNRVTATILINAGNANNAVLTTAPRAVFTGSKSIGQYALLNNAGTLEIAEVNQLGSGAGDGGGGLTVEYQDVSFTAEAGKHYLTNALLGAIAVTLPTADLLGGETIRFSDPTFSWGNPNNVTLNGGAIDIFYNNVADPILTLDLRDTWVELVYDDTNARWATQDAYWPKLDDLFIGALEIQGSLYINGRERRSSRTVTATTVLTTSDNLVFAVPVAANIDVTLPAHLQGASVTILRGSPVFLVTVLPGSGTIVGAASYLLGAQYDAAEFISDGTNWYIR